MILLQVGTLAKWWGPAQSHTWPPPPSPSKEILEICYLSYEIYVLTVAPVGQNQIVLVSMMLNSSELDLNTL